MAHPSDSKTPIDNPTRVDSHDHVETAFKHDELAAEAVAQGQALSGYENLTFWETVRTFKMASLLCLLAAFSAGADGYQIAMQASIIANKGFVQQFATAVNEEGEKFLASNIIATWSAGQNVGQVLGQIGISFVVARFGRKISMYTLWTILMSSVLAESLARAWPVWFGAKMLAGTGVGCLQATLLGYITEVSPTRVRGGMLMLYSFWWTLGSFCTHVALQRLNKTDPFNWLTPVYTQWGHIGVMAVIYVLLPESPSWCVTVGQEERAKKSIRFIYRGVENFDVNRHYELLALNVEHEKALAAEQRNESWMAIFKGTDGRRTITAMWTIVAQQFLGLALFGSFGTYFFQQAGLADPFQIKAITTSLQIIVVILAVFGVDKFGRRRMACCATSLMWISCLLVGIIGVAPQSGASTSVFVLFACFWNIGISANGAAGWGYIGEISSQRLRPYTSGFAASANSVTGLIMSVLTPYMVNSNKWDWKLKTGFFYAGVGLPWVIGTWLLVPETARRSPAELDELFEPPDAERERGSCGEMMGAIMSYFGLRGKPLSTLLSIVAATAFALQGYDQAVMNGLLTLDTFKHQFPQIKNSNIEGTAVAIYEVGCAIGALSCAFLGDVLGRRRTIFIAGCIVIMGVAIQSSSFSLGQLIASRVITGLRVGALTATIPMWVSECSSAKERGRRVLLQGFFAIGGIVVASWMEFGLYFIKDNQVNFRFPIAFQGLFAIIITSFVMFLPESPRWLIKQDRFEEAILVMAALEDLPDDSEVIREELSLIRDAYIEEQNQKVSVFTMGPERQFHRAVLAVGLAILAQMSGINIVTFYSTTIFQQQLNYSPTESRIFSASLQVWQFIAAGIALVLIDRFGRRKLLMAGALGMCVAQTSLAGLMSDLTNKSASEAAIFFYFVAMFFFPVGLFLLPFMYAAEISPLSIRAQITAISACANWLFNFLVAEVSPHALKNIGYKYYIVNQVLSTYIMVRLNSSALKHYFVNFADHASRPVSMCLYFVHPHFSLDDLDMKQISRHIRDRDGDLFRFEVFHVPEASNVDCAQHYRDELKARGDVFEKVQEAEQAYKNWEDKETDAQYAAEREHDGKLAGLVSSQKGPLVAYHGVVYEYTDATCKHEDEEQPFNVVEIDPALTPNDYSPSEPERIGP
ncbi:hypothetical protein CEK26_003630 [Fusarium fujikuroi]|nr:hypothetical protein CEK27_003622 [Fusarium fujikuroi]QGJ02186.1 hypothetical protein CEK26_003630 [Fusarium fujikuroi]